MIRYTMHAYVCGRSCVRLTQHEGAMTFNQIFLERPADCRYAIAEFPAGYFLVWDLLEVATFQQTDAVFLAPKPTRTTRDVSSAIVATTLLYDK